uniref:Uncharacterized protein n=1 Tax=Wuchereria bancrofti TaxID=6293 RepID=A0A1I8EJX4_WUCBA
MSFGERSVQDSYIHQIHTEKDGNVNLCISQTYRNASAKFTLHTQLSAMTRPRCAAPSATQHVAWLRIRARRSYCCSVIARVDNGGKGFEAKTFDDPFIWAVNDRNSDECGRVLVFLLGMRCTAFCFC